MSDIVERLESAREAQWQLLTDTKAEVQLLRTRRAALVAEIERLRRALREVAKWADYHDATGCLQVAREALDE